MANTDSCSLQAPAVPAPPEMPRRDSWRALIEECDGSGLTQAEFCRQRGIKRRSLSFWKWKLSRPAGAGVSSSSGRGRPPRRPAFVPVRVRSGAATPSAVLAGEGEIELVLERGRLVRVRGRVGTEWLRQVIGVLESTRC